MEGSGFHKLEMSLEMFALFSRGSAGCLGWSGWLLYFVALVAWRGISGGGQIISRTEGLEGFHACFVFFSIFIPFLFPDGSRSD